MGLFRTLFCLCALLVSGALQAAAPGRIVAIGDLHGDHQAFSDIAVAAGLVDGDGDWAAGDTVLVQMGDVTDRGPDSLKIIRDLQRLEKQAEAAGGAVIALVGNHEAMNVIGDLRYVHPGEYEAFKERRSKLRRNRFYRENRQQIEAELAARMPDATADQRRAAWHKDHPLGWIEHRVAWQPGGELASWYATKPAIAKVGDTLFVHGGISAAVAARGIDAVNAEISAQLAAPTLGGPLEAQDGPLWYRGNLPRFAGERTPEAVEEELDQVLAMLKARRLVIAHTPELGGIDAMHDGRLVRIDTGMADHYGGRPAFLEIRDGASYAIEQGEDGSWMRRVLPEPGEMP